MILIVGLGNPGKKFKNTRHNLGFQVLDQFQKENDFPSFKLSKKFKSEISQGIISRKKIILAKPQTFMNESGKGVKLLFKFYKIKLSDLWIVHDDLDLLVGKMKISKNRGSAGHKGVQSIINEFGTKSFVRLRIGIQANLKKSEKNWQKYVESFVLKKFNKGEEKSIKEGIEKTCRAMSLLLKQGIEKTMSEFNN